VPASQENIVHGDPKNQSFIIRDLQAEAMTSGNAAITLKLAWPLIYYFASPGKRSKFKI
jgi:hypothetical protein